MRSNKPSRRGIIEAAGGILWRESTQGREIALIHRTRYDDWALPKGWLNHGETFAEAAVREVFEETNCLVELGDFAGCISYLVAGVPKIVLFWQMQLVEEQRFLVDSEVDQLKWLTISEALAVMDYEEEKSLLNKIGRGV